MSSRTSDLVDILISFMSKCGLQLSMHLFLAKKYVSLKTVGYNLLEVRTNFWVLCFFLVDCFGQMESINLAGVLQEVGDADSRGRTRSQM